MASLDEVYAIHDAIEELSGLEVGGYKLGAAGAADEADGTPCLAVSAPLFKDFIFPSAALASASSLKLFGVEVEVAFRLKADLRVQPAQTSFTRSEVLAAVGSAHLALELVGSRFADVKKAAPLQRLADCVCAGGAILGPELPLADLDELRVLAASIEVDGALIDAGDTTQVPCGDPVSALVWCANHLASRDKALLKGHVVMSGKLCLAIHDAIAPFQRIQASLQDTSGRETAALASHLLP